MTFNNYTIVMTGIGGQGLISLIQILGDALMTKGYKVITSETHGLSQRGGKVVCLLHFGSRLSAPIPIIGSADMIIATEKSCILDVLKYAKPNKTTKLIITNYEEKLINERYPTETYLMDMLHESSSNIYFIPTKDSGEKFVKNLKTLNIIILGYALRFLPLNKKEIENSLIQRFSGKNLEINIKAFKKGLELT